MLTPEEKQYIVKCAYDKAYKEAFLPLVAGAVGRFAVQRAAPAALNAVKNFAMPVVQRAGNALMNTGVGQKAMQLGTNLIPKMPGTVKNTIGMAAEHVGVEGIKAGWNKLTGSGSKTQNAISSAVNPAPQGAPITNTGGGLANMDKGNSLSNTVGSGAAGRVF